MTTDAPKTQRRIKNPSIEELNKITDINNANSIPVSKEEVTEKPIIVGSLKPNESIFSPKLVKHKLVAGKHNYKHLDNVDEDGYIYIRRMTAIEEAKFFDTVKNITFESVNKVITEVLDNCIRSNISIYDLYSIEKIALFIHIIALTYGNVQDFMFACGGEKCLAEDLEYIQKVDLIEDLEINYIPENLIIPIPIEIKSYDIPLTLYLHYPTIAEEEFFMEETPSIITKIRSLVDKIEGKMPDGSPIPLEMYDQIIVNLEQFDTDKINKAVIDVTKYGLKLSDLEYKFCTNKKCELHLKPQKVNITFEQILKLIYK